MTSQSSSNHSLPFTYRPSSPESIIESVALVLICFTSAIGNTCVITAVARSERLRERPGSYIVGSLAVLDGVLMPIAMAFKIVLPIFPSETSKSVCEFLSIYSFTICYDIILHLFLMSLDRFIAVVYPLRGPTVILTRRKVLYLLLPAWSLPIFSIGIVPFLLSTQDQGASFRGKMLGCTTTSGTIQPTEDLTPSKAHQIHHLVNALVFVIGPFLAMLVLYGKLSLISFKQEKRIDLNIANVSENERRVKIKTIKEMKWAKTVGIVIGAFAITFIPSFTCSLVEVRFGPDVIPHGVFQFFVVVVFLNSAVNVFIYSFRSVEYRREFKMAMRDLVRKVVPGFGTGMHGRVHPVASSSIVPESRRQATNFEAVTSPHTPTTDKDSDIQSKIVWTIQEKATNP